MIVGKEQQEKQDRGNRRGKRWMPKQTLSVVSFFFWPLFLSSSSLPSCLESDPSTDACFFACYYYTDATHNILYVFSRRDKRSRTRGKDICFSFTKTQREQTERRPRRKEKIEGLRKRKITRIIIIIRITFSLSFAVTALLTLDFCVCGQSLLLLSSLWKHYSVYGFFKTWDWISFLTSETEWVCLSVCDNMNPNTESPCESDRKWKGCMKRLHEEGVMKGMPFKEREDKQRLTWDCWRSCHHILFMSRRKRESVSEQKQLWNQMMDMISIFNVYVQYKQCWFRLDTMMMSNEEGHQQTCKAKMTKKMLSSMRDAKV